MRNAVIIKSFQNGISVYLNEEIPFLDLLDEVVFKFRESRNFFKNAKMAISLEGRALTEEEERMVLNAICENSDLHIVCLVGKRTKITLKRYSSWNTETAKRTMMVIFTGER